MPLQRIANRLRLTIGLATESLGNSALEGGAQLRQRTLGIATLEEYESRVGWDASELTAIEELVVPETVFFGRTTHSVSSLHAPSSRWLPRRTGSFAF